MMPFGRHKGELFMDIPPYDLRSTCAGSTRRLIAHSVSRTSLNQSNNFSNKDPRPMPLYTVGSQSDLPQSVMDYLANGATQGERNQRLFAAACQCRDCGLRQDVTETTLLDRAKADGLSQTEAHKTIGSVYARSARKPAHGSNSSNNAAPPPPSSSSSSSSSNGQSPPPVPLPTPAPDST